MGLVFFAVRQKWFREDRGGVVGNGNEKIMKQILKVEIIN
jgi:hypothetical protein